MLYVAILTLLCYGHVLLPSSSRISTFIATHRNAWMVGANVAEYVYVALVLARVFAVPPSLEAGLRSSCYMELLTEGLLRTLCYQVRAHAHAVMSVSKYERMVQEGMGCEHVAGFT